MTTLRLYKFLVVAVAQQLDDDGNVVAEVQPPQPDTLFGVDALKRYAAGIEDAFAQHTAQLNGAPPRDAVEAAVPTRQGGRRAGRDD